MKIINVIIFALVGVFTAVGGPIDSLIWDLYPGNQKWKVVYEKQDKKSWIVEKIPEENKKDDLSDLLVGQRFSDQKKVSADEFAKKLIKGAKKTCEVLRFNGPNSSIKYGYEVAYIQIYCGLRKGTNYGTETFMKIMKCNDIIYVVTRELRVPPSQSGGITSFSEDQLVQLKKKAKTQKLANEYLSTYVYLCGPNTDDPKCENDDIW